MKVYWSCKCHLVTFTHSDLTTSSTSRASKKLDNMYHESNIRKDPMVSRFHTDTTIHISVHFLHLCVDFVCYISNYTTRIYVVLSCLLRIVLQLLPSRSDVVRSCTYHYLGLVKYKQQAKLPGTLYTSSMQPGPSMGYLREGQLG